MPLNPELLPLEPCPCGEVAVSVLMFERNRGQVVCPRCHRHGKTGTSVKQASLKWNEWRKKLSGEACDPK
jgi:hypothetical protein